MGRYHKFIVGLVWVILFVLFFAYFGSIVMWLLISLFIVMVGSPIMKLLRKIVIKKFIFPKWLAALLTLLAIFSVIAIVISIFVPLIVDQVTKFQGIDIETVSEGLEKPIKKFDDFMRSTQIFNQPDFSVEDFVLDKISSLLSFSAVTKLLNNIWGTAWQFIFSLFSIVFISFFFLKDKESIGKSILKVSSIKIQNEIKIIYASIKTLITRYLFGVILEVFCMITLFTLGFYLVGVDFNLALLVGLMGGLLNVIPYIGPWIGAGIGVILISIANIDMGFEFELLALNIKVLIVVAIAQIIDNVFFQPIIYSKSIKAHPVEIYLVIIIAGSIYGIIGMMLAIPVYTILRVIAKEILHLNKIAADAEYNKKNEIVIKNENI